MQVILQNKNQKERHLYIPNALLLNRLTSFLIARGLEKCGVHMSYEQISMIAERIHAVRKRHPDWVLLEGSTASGETMKIIL